MRAVFYQIHGDAQVLQVGELDKPACGPEQVLVEVAAAGVNPIDRRLRAGELTEYIQRTFPVVPGFDVSGRIAEVGTAVTDWQVGDEIMGLAFTWSIQHGTYA
ncbi:MAG: alcohol dehydrogenase catalytic domain-containing protein, partial [Halieaceae bacterium]